MSMRAVAPFIRIAKSSHAKNKEHALELKDSTKNKRALGELSNEGEEEPLISWKRNKSLILEGDGSGKMSSKKGMLDNSHTSLTSVCSQGTLPLDVIRGLR